MQELKQQASLAAAENIRIGRRAPFVPVKPEADPPHGPAATQPLPAQAAVHAQSVTAKVATVLVAAGCATDQKQHTTYCFQMLESHAIPDIVHRLNEQANEVAMLSSLVSRNECLRHEQTDKIHDTLKQLEDELEKMHGKHADKDRILQLLQTKLQEWENQVTGARQVTKREEAKSAKEDDDLVQCGRCGTRFSRDDVSSHWCRSAPGKRKRVDCRAVGVTTGKNSKRQRAHKDSTLNFPAAGKAKNLASDTVMKRQLACRGCGKAVTNRWKHERFHCEAFNAAFGPDAKQKKNQKVKKNQKATMKKMKKKEEKGSLLAKTRPRL